MQFCDQEKCYYQNKIFSSKAICLVCQTQTVQMVITVDNPINIDKYMILSVLGKTLN